MRLYTIWTKLRCLNKATRRYRPVRSIGCSNVKWFVKKWLSLAWRSSMPRKVLTEISYWNNGCHFPLLAISSYFKLLLKIRLTLTSFRRKWQKNWLALSSRLEHWLTEVWLSFLSSSRESISSACMWTRTSGFSFIFSFSSVLVGSKEWCFG